MNTATIPEPAPIAEKAGKHAGETTYLERWAKRYPNLQAKIERGRLNQGLAKHRGHRNQLENAA
ncbi:MAG: hypothetical protein L0G87_16850 [Renibacterium salmoninarum]|nr:hypothetical protein [Renibacterium salmoninarum]